MRCLALALFLLLACATPAAAYDPDRERTAPEERSPAARVQVPAGLYRVTEVYAGDVVTRSGDLTRYETLTAHEVTDTYARALETVATGARSAFDGTAFNGRASLSGGALVAGTYYENYVFDGSAYLPVSIVFFQDDAELARRAAATASPSRATTPPPPIPAPSPRSAAPSPPRSAPPAPARTLGPVIVGVDPTGGPAVLDALEVARGAAYALRVNVRGDAVLDAWSLVGGTNDASNATGWHAAATRLAAMWLRLPAPGATWTLALRVRLVPVWGGAMVERDATIRIGVRSPAVVE